MQRHCFTRTPVSFVKIHPPPNIFLHYDPWALSGPDLHHVTFHLSSFQWASYSSQFQEFLRHVLNIYSTHCIFDLSLTVQMSHSGRAVVIVYERSAAAGPPKQELVVCLRPAPHASWRGQYLRWPGVHCFQRGAMFLRIVVDWVVAVDGETTTPCSLEQVLTVEWQPFISPIHTPCLLSLSLSGSDVWVDSTVSWSVLLPDRGKGAEGCAVRCWGHQHQCRSSRPQNL